jgi:EmrB/QacA subfamily drug resistance transporter
MNSELIAPVRRDAVLPELGRNRRVVVLLVSCLSLFIAGLDVTVVNIALPSIAVDLRTSVPGLQWTVDAYTVVLASLLMLCGAVSDRLGRRRMFIGGLVVFTVGSLLSSLAPSVGGLVAARILQALGGAILNPAAVSIIATTFTDPRERARAVGVRGSVFGVSLALGPIVGGALVSSAGWRSIFLVNVPVGIIAIILAVRYIPESRAPRPRRFDPIGQLLVAVLFAALTYGIIEAPGHGWTSPAVLGALVAAGVALVCLPGYERRRTEALIDPRFFRSVPFTAASAIAVLAFAAFGGFLFLTTLYLQDVRGLSPVRAVLATLPLAVLAMVGSLVSGRVLATRGSRPVLVASGAFCVVGCAILLGVTPTTRYARLFAGYVAFGLGFGLVNAPVTDTAVAGMPRAQAGVAAAIASTSRQVGQTLGVAVAGAIVSSRAVGSAPAGFAAASRPVWWVLTACGGLALFLGFLATTGWARASARGVAAELNPEVLGGQPRSRSDREDGRSPRSRRG